MDPRPGGRGEPSPLSTRPDPGPSRRVTSSDGTALAVFNRLGADGKVVEIPGAKHAAHHTHPDLVVDAVRGFLT